MQAILFLGLVIMILGVFAGLISRGSSYKGK